MTATPKRNVRIERSGVLPGFLAAIQFLTRVPIRLHSAPDMGKAVPWFPVVGALIGAFLGGVAAVLMELVPAAVAASLTVVIGVMLTGAFHEDGLADTADALGGMTPARRREILRDSRHGSYGVAAMCSTIVIRIVAVAGMGPAVAVASLVAAHALGRGAAVGVMASAPPVPESGLGADFTRSLSRVGAATGLTAALVLSAVAAGWWVAPFALAALVGAIAVAKLAVRAFEGVSGDHLGAVEQVVECLVLVVATGLATRHPVWWV